MCVARIARCEREGCVPTNPALCSGLDIGAEEETLALAPNLLRRTHVQKSNSEDTTVSPPASGPPCCWLSGLLSRFNPY